ncbi:hypothetical protein [Amycolatopsis sp. NPDC021455]|uniref:hypothetical protein n=1 Tax=Amycolatopsis sp. NPDC021455 TaxID=3154901 RepID=UPI0033CC6D59
MSPEEKFEVLVDEFTGRPGITPPGATGGFGRTALRAHGRIFAMFVRGQLVLKLPRARVDELVEGGHGVRFDANKGTPMKEWLALDAGSPQPWSALTEEALEFAGRK